MNYIFVCWSTWYLLYACCCEFIAHWNWLKWQWLLLRPMFCSIAALFLLIFQCNSTRILRLVHIEIQSRSFVIFFPSKNLDMIFFCRNINQNDDYYDNIVGQKGRHNSHCRFKLLLLTLSKSATNTTTKLENEIYHVETNFKISISQQLTRPKNTWVVLVRMDFFFFLFSVYIFVWFSTR